MCVGVECVCVWVDSRFSLGPLSVPVQGLEFAVRAAWPTVCSSEPHAGLAYRINGTYIYPGRHYGTTPNPRSLSFRLQLR